MKYKNIEISSKNYDKSVCKVDCKDKVSLSDGDGCIMYDAIVSFVVWNNGKKSFKNKFFKELFYFYSVEMNVWLYCVPLDFHHKG